MLQFEAWKKTLVILVAALGIIYAAPNLLPVEREGGGILPGQKINLGLDLQGGSHLLLRVDMDAVVEERLEPIEPSLLQLHDAPAGSQNTPDVRHEQERRLTGGRAGQGRRLAGHRRLGPMRLARGRLAPAQSERREENSAVEGPEVH